MLDNQQQRKGLRDEDLIALQGILGNVTLTRSGMLRVMAFLVENPDLAKKGADLVFSIEQIAKNTENISKELEKLNRELPALIKMAT